MKCVVCESKLLKKEYKHFMSVDGKVKYVCGDCSRFITIATLRSNIPAILKKLKAGKTMVTWED